MSLTFEQDMRVRSALAELHTECFTRDMKVTLVARHPTDRECHLVCGDDDLAAVAELVRGKVGPLDMVLPCPRGERDTPSSGVPFHTTARPPTPAERVEDALVVILSSWDRWSAEAAQQAQQDQHPDSYTDAMNGYLRPILESIQ